MPNVDEKFMRPTSFATLAAVILRMHRIGLEEPFASFTIPAAFFAGLEEEAIAELRELTVALLEEEARPHGTH